MLQIAHRSDLVDPDIKHQVDWWHDYLEELHDIYHDQPKFKDTLKLVLLAGYQIINDLAKKITTPEMEG